MLASMNFDAVAKLGNCIGPDPWWMTTQASQMKLYSRTFAIREFVRTLTGSAANLFAF